MLGSPFVTRDANDGGNTPMAKKIGIAAGALAAAAAPVVRKLAQKEAPARNDPKRWHAVTVNCPQETVEGRGDTPLAALGDRVEVRLRPAPGDRGTEVAARLRSGGDEEVRELRRALRETRALLEIGWVPTPDRPTTTRATPLNAPLRAATAHGREEGRL
jgi:hypothetical protein